MSASHRDTFQRQHFIHHGIKESSEAGALNVVSWIKSGDLCLFDNFGQRDTLARSHRASQNADIALLKVLSPVVGPRAPIISSVPLVIGGNQRSACAEASMRFFARNVD